jgi:hypothetical protein
MHVISLAGNENYFHFGTLLVETYTYFLTSSAAKPICVGCFWPVALWFSLFEYFEYVNDPHIITALTNAIPNTFFILLMFWINFS